MIDAMTQKTDDNNKNIKFDWKWFFIEMEKL